MTVRGFLSEIVGSLLILAAFAWAGFDAYSHAGRAAMTTLAVALVLAAIGGFLISKHKTLELFDFLFAQADRARAFRFPSAGSDVEK